MPSAAIAQEVEILRHLHETAPRWRHDAEALARQVAELQMLQRQTAAELDRLGPRSNQAAQRIRDMEAHIESYSRTDIRDLYAAAHEAQMRLFMMQLQREQIEHKLKVLNAHHDALVQVATLAERVKIEDDQGKAAGSTGEAVTAEESISRIIQAQEDERRRISRQIHDGPAQAMANLVLRAEICERLVENPGHVRRELINLKKLVTDSLAETRQFIFDLRPMILDDLGLAPTLRRYCEMLSERGGVSIRLSVAGGERRFDQTIEIVVFRIAQEALRNALKHGQASDILVTLEGEASSVAITVEDDGRGCEATAVLALARRGRAMGIARMEEYARSCDGTFEFQGELARGCRVKATVPLVER